MPKLVLLWVSATFLAGIITAGATSITIEWSWGLILVALLFFFYRLNKKKKFGGTVLFLSLLLAAFYCGALRYQSFVEKTTVGFGENITPGEMITIQGIVAEPTQPSTQYGETVLELHRYLDPNGNWQPAEGKVVVRLPEFFGFRVHTSLTLQGIMDSTVKADAKPYTSWLKRNGVDYRMFFPTVVEEIPSEKITFKGLLYSFRNRAYQTLQTIVPYPESELLAGILLGIDSRIPAYLSEAYRLTGTAHILAISGFNIALIAGMVTKYLNRVLPYRLGAFISMGIIATYALLVGAQPSVLRAAWMAIIAIPAYLIGRRSIGIHTLAITAAIMAFFNPYLVWDASFQLSVCATFGILMYTDFITQKTDAFLQKKDISSKELVLEFIKNSVIIAFSAQLAAFPVLARQFEEISLISPLVNLFILPLQPIIMILGGVALVCGMVFYPLGRLVGLLAWMIAAFNDQIVLLFSTVPTTLAINPVGGFWIGLGLNGVLAYFVLRERKRAFSQPGRAGS